MLRYFFDLDDVADPTSQLLIASDKASSEFLGLGSEFWAAIAGALVGGAISFFVQMYAARGARLAREAEQFEIKQAIARSLLIKFKTIADNFRSITIFCNETKGRMSSDEYRNEPCKVIQPVPNIPDKIDFESQEFSILLSKQGSKIFNEVQSLSRVHNSSISIFHHLSEAQKKLVAAMPASVFDGYKASTILSEEQYNLLKPKMLDVNSLFVSLDHYAQTYDAKIMATLMELAKFLSDEFGVKVSIQQVA